MYSDIVKFIRELYKTDSFIPLHEPKFRGNEKKYLEECIDSTFVSSVGIFVDRVEQEFAKYIGSRFAIATVNGTSALHIALILAGVKQEDEVITQPLTFIATSNAISYIGAKPIYVDVDLDTLGLSPTALKHFLETKCEVKDNRCINKVTNKVIKACLSMHTFGHPCKIEEIKDICNEWNISLVEDCAESLGSFYKAKHTGTFGKLGVFSFNGNKIITSGGGGVIVTDDEELAKRAKHLTTTAKVAHKWEYVHDEIGYNYRMPNLNAALLVAQLEELDSFIIEKRKISSLYKEFFKSIGLNFVDEPIGAISNFWLNAVICKNIEQRDALLEYTNNNSVMTRPIWKLMNKLSIYENCQKDDLKNSLWLENRVVNLPSSVI